MNNTIEARKNQLRQEIFFAKQRLEENLQQVDFKDYLRDSLDFLPNLSSKLITQPLQNLGDATSQILDKQNLLSKLNHFFTMIINLIKAFK